ncbi:MAG: TatD family hydrolase [Verrucomicrobiales bacterium]
MLVETHAHLDYPDFAPDFAEVLARAKEAEISKIVTIGVSLESSRRAIALAEQHPQVYAVVGSHPTDLSDTGNLSQLGEELLRMAQHPKVAAIGESGLDYYRLPSSRMGEVAIIEAAELDSAYIEEQKERFSLQLKLAEETGLNMVIHQRSAWEDTLEMMKPFEAGVRGVFHCFVGDPAQAQQLVERGHLVSFTGIVTFKNGKDVLQTATQVPLEHLMVETDCPYLAPTPFRGKRCEPAHTRLVAQQIAMARGMSLADFATATTRTAENFFRLA